MHNSASSPRCNTNGLGDYVSGQGQCDGRQRYSSDVYAGLSRLGGELCIDRNKYCITLIRLTPSRSEVPTICKE